MHPRGLLMAGTLLFVTTIAQAEVYKCPDGKGGALFQNMPCVTAAERPVIPHVATAQERSKDQADEAVAAIGQQALPVDYQQQIDTRLGAQLKDPESRRVTYLGSYGSAACGTVNAKNSLGGYAGNQVFLAIFPRSGLLQEVHTFSAKKMADVPFLNNMYAQLLRQCGIVKAQTE